jgi:hypothetical protein
MIDSLLFSVLELKFGRYMYFSTVVNAQFMETQLTFLFLQDRFTSEEARAIDRLQLDMYNDVRQVGPLLPSLPRYCA